MNGATLYRSNKPSWRFEWDGPSRMYLHRTKRGNVYAIIGIEYGKPIWIGRLTHYGSWITAEAEIGAECIGFDSGGCYWFGNRE